MPSGFLAVETRLEPRQPVEVVRQSFGRVVLSVAEDADRSRVAAVANDLE